MAKRDRALGVDPNPNRNQIVRFSSGIEIEAAQNQEQAAVVDHWNRISAERGALGFIPSLCVQLDLVEVWGSGRRALRVWDRLSTL